MAQTATERDTRHVLRDSSATAFQGGLSLQGAIAALGEIFQPSAYAYKDGPAIKRLEHIGEQLLPLLPNIITIFFTLAIVFFGVSIAAVIGEFDGTSSKDADTHMRTDFGIAALLFFLVLIIASFSVGMVKTSTRQHASVIDTTTADPDLEAGRLGRRPTENPPSLERGPSSTHKRMAVIGILTMEFLLLTAFLFIFLALKHKVFGVGLAGVVICGSVICFMILCWTMKFVTTEPSNERIHADGPQTSVELETLPTPPLDEERSEATSGTGSEGVP
jgi:hypothetical protein